MAIRAATLFASVLLAACSTQSPVPSGTQMVASRSAALSQTILVVSVAADKFHRMHRGLTVFGNEDETVDGKSTAINRQLEKWLANTVAAAGHSPVLTGESAGLTETNNLRAVDTAPIWAQDPWGSWTQLAPQLKLLAEKNSASTILLIRAGQNGDGVGGFLRFPRGVGVYSHFNSGALAFAMIDVIVVDGKTGKPYERLSVLVRDGMFKATPTGKLPQEYGGKKLPVFVQPDFDLIANALEPQTQVAFDALKARLTELR